MIIILTFNIISRSIFCSNRRNFSKYLKPLLLIDWILMSIFSLSLRRSLFLFTFSSSTEDPYEHKKSFGNIPSKTAFRILTAANFSSITKNLLELSAAATSHETEFAYLIRKSKSSVYSMNSFQLFILLFLRKPTPIRKAYKHIQHAAAKFSKLRSLQSISEKRQEHIALCSKEIV